MKLAIVTETFPTEVNGVAMTFGTIARELGRRGHEVTIYRPQRDDLPAAGTVAEYREVPMRGMQIPGYPLLRLGLPARMRLKHYWRQDRPDLVHVVTEGPPSTTVPSSTTGRKLSCWLRLKRWISSMNSSVPCPMRRR